ncbi:DNA-binding IclR family transcriptional regulator [Arthrobacter sp. 1088]|uniref:IclR family transcriptional regulator n=1 Tax=Arthrobacter sp. 1088 TaxID=2817768 RepID=UPI00285B44D0|nr:IclR family transcriptional regulator [Arthrobacter sp. 1088]MDR6688633.1 DNA-binding IclR family transcriptional regulator [Arthrobacter sp. 1088]
MSVDSDIKGPESTTKNAGDRRVVGSLLHGLEILQMFSRERRIIGIGEMASQLGLHKSSASRLASTLAYAGFLEADVLPGTYRVGSKIAALGTLAEQDLDIERTVLPYLRWLTWRTGETGHLAILEGGNAKTIAITDGWHTVRMHSWVGKSAPAYVSSMGKALLAGLNADELHSLYRDEDFVPKTDQTVKNYGELEKDLMKLRGQGYGFDNEELEYGLRCISAPIVGPDNTVVASISISGPSQRMTLERIAQVAAQVRWAARGASLALGSAGTPSGWKAAPGSAPEPLAWVEEIRSPERIPEPQEPIWISA